MVAIQYLLTGQNTIKMYKRPESEWLKNLYFRLFYEITVNINRKVIAVHKYGQNFLFLAL